MYKYVFPVVSIVLFLSCTKKNDSITAEKNSNETAWSQSIFWTECPPQPNDENEKNKLASASPLKEKIHFECGTLTVPLDWQNISGKTIELSLKRALATKQNDKIGSLVINPGGPGGSGVEFIHDVIHANSELRNKFDIVGFDPRGVKASTPLNCKHYLKDSIFSLLNSEQNFVLFQEQVKSLKDSCKENDNEIIDYMNTENVVKDLEAIRVALGNEKLNYFGVSYGTSIGATYAYRYPNNTRAMMLDGVVDQSQAISEIVKNETMAVKNSFTEFSKYCMMSVDCNLTAKEINYILENLKDEYPVKNDKQAEKITKAELLTSLAYAVTEFENWKIIARIIGKLNKLNPDLNFEDIASFLFITPAEIMQFYAVECLDYPMKHFSWQDYLTLKEQSKKIFPAVNGFVLSLNTYAVCSAWENKRHDPLVKNHIFEKEQPVLLVSSLFDAITPHSNALLKHKQIAGSKLLQSLESTHGVSVLVGATCVHEYINQFFTTVTLPTDYLLCDVR